ncbi:hypothetical protein L1887_57198 [Cichorium endivia]|nr:hypothetical protein L1887_57198 [Cichorium endivia]
MVLPVGGLKEKLLAAHRAGITKVILPAQNQPNVEADVPKAVLDDLEVHYVNKRLVGAQPCVWRGTLVGQGERDGGARAQGGHHQRTAQAEDHAGRWRESGPACQLTR